MLQGKAAMFAPTTPLKQRANLLVRLRLAWRSF
jgi:hypothetical protein